MIYINGIRASKKDIARLLKDLKKGIVTATATTTKKGALSIKADF